MRIRKYAPRGWYKMRNEKMYEQLRHGIGINSIAEYWRLEPTTVRDIIKCEMEKRANAQCRDRNSDKGYTSLNARE